uniref:hypothetical protein n=1 Tax=Rhodococcus qingshengii TaxID=334542 RepID=UPI001C4E0394|nr:hypothetical protein [Rhodococcus qingshengii]
MHTAKMLDVSKFEVSIEARPKTCSDLFPGWHPWDRFGIVVHDAYGAIGASLLIQAAVAEFFRARRAGGRRDIYPEIYAFHVGRDHGDLSMYDFWPFHKEVVVDNDPVKVLHALNDRGITRLAVPDGTARLTEYLWPELHAAQDRIQTVVAYSAGGQTERADVELKSLSRDVEFNTETAFDIVDFSLSLTGSPNLTDDERRFVGHVWSRQFNNAPSAREEARLRYEANRTGGLSVETYRREDVAFALSHLAP